MAWLGRKRPDLVPSTSSASATAPTRQSPSRPGWPTSWPGSPRGSGAPAVNRRSASGGEVSPRPGIRTQRPVAPTTRGPGARGRRRPATRPRPTDDRPNNSGSCEGAGSVRWRRRPVPGGDGRRGGDDARRGGAAPPGAAVGRPGGGRGRRRGVPRRAAVLNPYRGQAPPCPFHELTGPWCPICGSSRALHSLLHGDAGAAFGHNPLLIALLPLLVWAWLAWTLDSVGGPHLSRIPAKRSGPGRLRGHHGRLLGRPEPSVHALRVLGP